MTFTFRIDPKAHWSDGKPITADDVIATYNLIMDETTSEPMSRDSFSKLEPPVKRSKYIVEFKVREQSWRNLYTVIGLLILPAHEIGDLSGEEYLDKYNFKLTAVSGGYRIDQKDIQTEKSITLTRRSDWWAKDRRQNAGLFNIDRIRFVVVREPRLAFDKACKGELDFMSVSTAKWWVEDLTPLPAVQNNQLIRRKVYTKFPKGIQGDAINMREPPLDDVRVRKALSHLYDRKTMLEKFAYNEYDRLKSYYPGSDAENLANVMVEYDPEAASGLLDEAGWKERGPDGIRTKDGKRLSITVTYRTAFFEKYLTVWQEAAKRAGLELKLNLLNPETAWNNLQDRSFQVSSIAWGATIFPSPKTIFHGSLADNKGANNFVGLNNPEIDAIIEEYDTEFDLQTRNELLRQLDALVFAEHPYVLGWYLPCERFVYWNKFGMPDSVLRKYDEWDDVFGLWWVDPEKENALKAAKKSGDKLPPVEMDVRPFEGQGMDALGR